MLDSGARVSAVLGLTARGLRMAHNPKIGIDVAAFVRNKGEHTLGKPIWCSADIREQLHRYIARDRSHLDPYRRTRLEQLGDDETIFLSRRKRQLEYSGFGHRFQTLARQCAAPLRLGSAASRCASSPAQLPGLTPHTIRHLHTTFRVKKVRELFSSPARARTSPGSASRRPGLAERRDAQEVRPRHLQIGVEGDHGLSVRQMVQDAPCDAASLQALLRRGAEFGQTYTTDEVSPRR